MTTAPRPPSTTAAPAGTGVRFGRLAALATSAVASSVAVLGAAGLVGSGMAASPALAAGDAATGAPAVGSAPTTDAAQGARRAVLSAAEVPPVTPAPAVPLVPLVPDEVEETAPLPPGSGQGRRAVYDESEQRVWLVGKGGEVRRTYLVSGSVYDNLDPGTYEVFSRSKQAWGIDDSGEMTHFVRFTHGDNAAIGFHSIPTKDGELLQTRDELGTPTSHGCIRQAMPDAKAMWRFAQIGDTVVVTA